MLNKKFVMHDRASYAYVCGEKKKTQTSHHHHYYYHHIDETEQFDKSNTKKKRKKCSFDEVCKAKECVK